MIQNNNLTDREKSDLSYMQEVKEHGEHCINLAIGNKNDYYKHVWKEGAATEFSKWLSIQEPDWQCDC
jgi:hypothetical protein